MKIYALFFLVLFLGCKESRKGDVDITETTNRLTDTIATDLYVLDLFNEESPDTITWTSVKNRVVYPDGSFDIYTYPKDDLNNPNYKQSFNSNGLPLVDAMGPDFENNIDTKFFKDRVQLNFRGKDTIVKIKQSDLFNPTHLWFWKEKPIIGDTIAVNLINKNFITNTISLRQSYYTYTGLETILVLSKPIDCHKVYNFWSKKEDDTYDINWYDDNGMLVQQIHHIGVNGDRIGKLSKIVKYKYSED